MKKMRLLVLSTLVLTGVNAQTNLNLDSWTSATAATGWTSTLDGYEAAVMGEEPPVNQDMNGAGSCARLNPIDLTSLVGQPLVVSIFGVGTDGDADLIPDGFAYTTRIESIDFDAKFTLAGDAIGDVEVYAINGADTIGVGQYNVTADISAFTAQNVVITYDPAFAGVNPTQVVLFAAVIGSDPAATTADFWVDNFVINDVNNASIEALAKDAWKVSTVNGNIVVSGVESGEVAVYNAAGQVIGTASVVNGQAVVNTNGLATGLTMVQLTQGNLVGTKKIIM